MMSFDHTTLAQRVLFGHGRAVDNVANAVSTLSGQRALLIADHPASSTADEVATRIRVTARIDDIVQHVPVARGDAAVALARKNDVDVVVSMGGGSATGLAKYVARETGVAIVAVPTTFAGSEATDVWGQTDGDRKTTGSDPAVLPRAVIYDSALFSSLPVSMAVASGLNAVAHAVDGFWAPRADPITTALGTEALRALIPGLRGVASDATDLDALERTLYGAYLAAVAFASAGSGLHHKICHVLGGAFALSHAETHAVVLPYVMALNASAAPDARQRVSDILGGVDAASGLQTFRAELGVVGSLRELGMPQTGIEHAVDRVTHLVPPTNPGATDRESLRALISAAWAGDPVMSREKQEAS